eukprot:190750-Chlamydomonas_euryale.AAC.1
MRVRNVFGVVADSVGGGFSAAGAQELPQRNLGNTFCTSAAQRVQGGWKAGGRRSGGVSPLGHQVWRECRASGCGGGAGHKVWRGCRASGV